MVRQAGLWPLPPLCVAPRTSRGHLARRPRLRLCEGLEDHRGPGPARLARQEIEGEDPLDGARKVQAAAQQQCDDRSGPRPASAKRQDERLPRRIRDDRRRLARSQAEPDRKRLGQPCIARAAETENRLIDALMREGTRPGPHQEGAARRLDRDGGALLRLGFQEQGTAFEKRQALDREHEPREIRIAACPRDQKRHDILRRGRPGPAGERTIDRRFVPHDQDARRRLGEAVAGGDGERDEARASLRQDIEGAKVEAGAGAQCLVARLVVACEQRFDHGSRRLDMGGELARHGDRGLHVNRADQRLDQRHELRELGRGRAACVRRRGP